MSHFATLVVGENPELQLEPFNENTQVEKYERSKVFHEDRNRFIKHYFLNSDLFAGEAENEIPLNWDVFEKLYEEEGEDWNSSAYEKDENGIWTEYSTYNPKSKWDWYVLGGRWSGMIKLKDGTREKKGRAGVGNNEVGIDAALKKNIANLDEIKTFADAVLKDGEFYERGEIKTFTDAVLKDGEFYERGEMGWWGIVNNAKDIDEWEAKQKELIDSLPDDTLISIYDLHI